MGFSRAAGHRGVDVRVEATGRHATASFLASFWLSRSRLDFRLKRFCGVSSLG